jgi:hypothetical protein
MIKNIMEIMQKTAMIQNELNMSLIAITKSLNFAGFNQKSFFELNPKISRNCFLVNLKKINMPTIKICTRKVLRNIFL